MYLVDKSESISREAQDQDEQTIQIQIQSNLNEINSEILNKSEKNLNKQISIVIADEENNKSTNKCQIKQK
jgi:preprotein translocase subunit SecD